MSAFHRSYRCWVLEILNGKQDKYKIHANDFYGNAVFLFSVKTVSNLLFLTKMSTKCTRQVSRGNVTLIVLDVVLLKNSSLRE